ncbi:MAG: two-component system, OmpR family, response regulator, partial [Acidimicrobiaceae bacterium]
VPALDEHGVLRFRGHWAALSPTEVTIVERLVAAYGNVVSRRALVAAIWPDDDRRSRALDPHVHRLRNRLRALGLDVHTIRGRGFVLAPST